MAWQPVPASDRNTLGGCALGQHVASAGALLDSRDDQGLRWPSPYSASGAVQGPSASAVADQGPALAGIRVAGHGSGQVLRANGTSMAAPLLACHLARAMTDGATRAQALAHLACRARAAGTDVQRGPDIG